MHLPDKGNGGDHWGSSAADHVDAIEGCSGVIGAKEGVVGLQVVGGLLPEADDFSHNEVVWPSGGDKRWLHIVVDLAAVVGKQVGAIGLAQALAGRRRRPPVGTC